jgi:hypothetical protein
MRRLCIRLPVTVEVTDEEADALDAIGRAANIAKESGIMGALVEAVRKTGKAAASRKRRRPTRARA